MRILSECRAGGAGWFEDYWYALEDDFIELPVPFSYSTLEADGYNLQVGVEYTVRPSKLWNTLRKLQYCRYEQRKEKYPVSEETKDLAQRFFLGGYVSSYTLEVFDCIPDNLMQSIRDHTSSAGIDYDSDSCSDDNE